MFYKIGFFVLLIIVIAMLWLFMRVNPMMNEGSPSWIDISSKSPDETIRFMNNVFGISVMHETKTASSGLDYKVVRGPGQIWPFAGVMPLPDKDFEPQSMIYITVRDYDAANKKMIQNGAKPILSDQKAAGMRFGIYIIPGGIHLGIAEWNRKYQK